MIMKYQVFNRNSVNIFTDASMTTLNTRETVGCSGCVVIEGNFLNIEKEYCINRNSTNNNSEIKALRLGVINALKYKDKYPNIRIFSDSQISILGIRERIFGWDIYDNCFIGTTGEIANQAIFIEIMNIILDYNLKIEFYHQKGHVKFTEQSLENAKKVFQASNNIREDIDDNLIKTLAHYNNIVDQESRKILLNTNLYKTNITQEAISFYCSDFDKSKYYRLIH